MNPIPPFQRLQSRPILQLGQIRLFLKTKITTSFEIPYGLRKYFLAIHEKPKAAIAVSAEDASNYSCFVVMVYVRLFCCRERRGTYLAFVPCPDYQGFGLLFGYSISVNEVVPA